MNRLLLLPGHFRYNPRVGGAYMVDDSIELTVPIYIVSQDGGLSLIVLCEDAPRLLLRSRSGDDWPARAGVYFQAQDDQCFVDLDAVARDLVPA